MSFYIAEHWFPLLFLINPKMVFYCWCTKRMEGIVDSDRWIEIIGHGTYMASDVTKEYRSGCRMWLDNSNNNNNTLYFHILGKLSFPFNRKHTFSIFFILHLHRRPSILAPQLNPHLISPSSTQSAIYALSSSVCILYMIVDLDSRYFPIVPHFPVCHNDSSINWNVMLCYWLLRYIIQFIDNFLFVVIMQQPVRK